MTYIVKNMEGTYLTRKLATQARKAKQGPANELAKHFVHGTDVESGMVSHICSKANFANARIITNLRVGVCDYSHKQLLLGPFLALRSLRNKESSRSC